MRQLNTIQAIMLALIASAAFYVITLGLFIAAGDFLRWAL